MMERGSQAQIACEGEGLISDTARTEHEAHAEMRAQPILKWAGGKRSVIAQLQRFVPPRFASYYEPFFGGGAFFFSLAPRVAVLGDINHDLIELYRAVRDEPEAVMAELDGMQPRVRDSVYYYQTRALMPDALKPARRAARLIFLNKTCYNGLYRVNRAGQFNVPFGRYKREPSLYNRDNVLAVSRLLKAAILRCADFETILSDVPSRAFVYLDPPYVPLSRTSSFTRYTAGSFEEAEQRRLAEVIRRLSKQGCFVLLSNSDTPLTRELYRDFEITTVYAPRNINSVASGRTRMIELAIRNYRGVDEPLLEV
jgi:DNA adenine methylase